jgi:hypothetical protein
LFILLVFGTLVVFDNLTKSNRRRTTHRPVEKKYSKTQLNFTTTMVMMSPTQQKDWDAKRKNYEGSSGKPDDFVCTDQSGTVSPRKKPVAKKWNNSPRDESAKVDDWMGASPDGSPSKARRSWRVKSVSNVPPPDVSD